MSIIAPKNSFIQTQPDSTTTFDMIHIEGGTFTMGAAADDPDASDLQGEKGQHPVALGSFFMDKYPVTQAVFKAVMDERNPSAFQGDDQPVEQVSWLDAAVFCNKLNEMLALEPCYFADTDFQQLYGKSPAGYELPNEGEVFIRPGTKGYRLPTEAEWEYAAQGGPHRQDNFTYSGSNKLKEVAWFDKNSHSETKPVGIKMPNQLGLCDMSGNVWEWCQDWWDEDYYAKCAAEGTVKNPPGAEKGSSRVTRGGSWLGDPQFCRSAYRGHWLPDARLSRLGFRLCLVFSEVGVSDASREQRSQETA